MIWKRKRENRRKKKQKIQRKIKKPGKMKNMQDDKSSKATCQRYFWKNLTFVKNISDDKFSRFRNKKTESQKSKNRICCRPKCETRKKSGKLFFSENSAQSKKIEKI